MSVGIEIGERYDSAEHIDSQSPQIIRKFRAIGSWDEAASYNAMCAYLGNRFQVVNNVPCDAGLPITEIRQNPMPGIAGYEFEVTFSTPDFKQPDAVEWEDYNYQLSAAGGSAHLTHSLETISATTLDGSDPQDFDGGIGLNENGTFDGVDVTFPQPQTTIEVSFPRTFFTRQYRIMLATYIGATNLYAFDGYAPGEVKLNSVNLKSVVFENPYIQQKDFYWRASFNFLISPNILIPFGDGLVLKPGWAYAWRLTERTENPTTKKIECKTKQINIERVSPELDFTALMLPLPQ